MLLKKIYSFISAYYQSISIVIFSLIYLFTTFYGSYFDVLNPDSINWHNRSDSFAEALKSGHYGNTYQVYHPGVTLMWLLGLGIYWNSEFPTKEVYLDYDFHAKAMLYIVLTLNFLVTLFVLRKYLKFTSLLLFSLIYTLEPFVLGIRRLVHLDALMTAFLFNSFLLLFHYSFTTHKIKHLVTSVFFFVLAFYTKSFAVVTLPVLFLIFLTGNSTVKTKIKAFLISILSGLLFLYLLLPALWTEPIKGSEIIFTKIYDGARLIGVEGRREIGTAGKGDNIVLKDSFSKFDNFYLDSLLYSTTPLLIIISFGSIFFVLVMFLLNLRNLKTVIRSNLNFILGIFSVTALVIFYLTLDSSVKSYERYSYIFYPFLILIVTLILNSINFKLKIIIFAVYLIVTLIELYKIFPYFYAYGNPLLGGSYARYEKLNSPPFGVAVVELKNKLDEYIRNNEKEYFPVIAGSKSLKAIFSSGRNERYPMCDVDYFVQYYDDKGPKKVCIGKKHKEIFSVYVGNIQYWRVYKFDNRSSKASKINIPHDKEAPDFNADVEIEDEEVKVN